MEWVEDHTRLLAFIVFVGASLVAVVLGQCGLAFLLAWIPVGMVWKTISNPESDIALQEDGRASERRRKKAEFLECLRKGRIEASEGEVECWCLTPLTFSFHPTTYSASEKKVREVAEESLPLFKATRSRVDLLPQNKDGYYGYEITYHTQTEVEVLSDMEVSYVDISDEEPSYKGFCVGFYENGERAYLDFDSKSGMCVGISRSGKSCFTSVVCSKLCECENERVIICSAKIMDFMAYAERAELYREPLEILEALKEVNKEAEWRKQYCLQNGLKKISRFTSEMPHITLILDEYFILKTSTVEDPDGKKPRKVGDECERELLRLICQNSAFGCQVFVVSQKLSVDILPSLGRDQLVNKVSFSSGSARADEQVFDTMAEEAKACEIPIEAKGVGYIYCEGSMTKPRMFKSAYIDEKTEKAIAERTKHLRPKGRTHERQV